MSITRLFLVVLLLGSITNNTKAQISYQDIIPDHIQNTWGFRSVHIDTPAITTLSMSGAGVLNIWQEFGTRTVLKAFSDCEVMISNGHPSALYLNDVISSSGSWQLPNYSILFDGSVGNWAGAVDQYLGVRVKSGIDWIYGWIRLDVNTAGNTVIIKDYACNQSPNAPINAGQTQGASPTYSTITINSCGPYTSPSGNYTWTISNTYSDTIQNVLGGDSIMTINLSVVLIDTSITISGFTLSSNAVAADSFQWIQCDNNNAPISGANMASFTPAHDGQYAVIIMSGNCTDTSNCYHIIGTGIYQNNASYSLKLFPNPAHESITIQFSKRQELVFIELFTINGQRVFHQSFYDFESGELPLNQLKPGMYLMRAQSDAVVLFRNIVLLK